VSKKKVFTLTDEDLAKVIAISIKGFGQSMGAKLPDDMIRRVKESSEKAINLFDEKSPTNETLIEEFVRIYDEEIVNG